MNTSSEVRAALYSGDDAGARRLAAESHEVDVFDAAALGDSERLQQLLRADPSLAHAWSDDGFTALHLAAFLGGPPAIQVLCNAGADVNAVAQNEMEVRPLHSAAASGNVEAVELLLLAGADPNVAQHGGWTPLDQAEHARNKSMAVLLREHGAQRSENQLPGE